jgi:hypothetical protein
MKEFFIVFFYLYFIKIIIHINKIIIANKY